MARRSRWLRSFGFCLLYDENIMVGKGGIVLGISCCDSCFSVGVFGTKHTEACGVRIAELHASASKFAEAEIAVLVGVYQ
jgi:hypothetical protein